MPAVQGAGRGYVEDVDVGVVDDGVDLELEAQAAVTEVVAADVADAGGAAEGAELAEVGSAAEAVNAVAVAAVGAVPVHAVLHLEVE